MANYRTYLCIAICCFTGGTAGFLIPGLDMGVGIAIGAGIGVAADSTGKTTNKWTRRHPHPKRRHN